MTGALMQIVAYGAQDIYLTGNPQITFYKVVYRRHTNFAIEQIEQTFNGAAELGKKLSCTISRNGDLLHKVYLEMDVSIESELKFTANRRSCDSKEKQNMLSLYGNAPGTNTGTSTDVIRFDTNDDGDIDREITNANGDTLNKNDFEITEPDTVSGSFRIGLRAIKSVEVEIGGQAIDKHYGDWMDIWVGLTHGGENYNKHNRMVNGSTKSSTNNKNRKLYIPLQFWFCKNPGLALPLIALQYHEVKINVQFNDSVKYTDVSAVVDADKNGVALIGGAGFTEIKISCELENTMTIENCCVFCDYVFLDTDERRRFAQVSHEYLIEQLQFSNPLSQSSGVDLHELRFNHPVKEMIWSVQLSSNNGKNFNYFNSSDDDMVKSALLQLNGHDRLRRREGTYYRCVQPYQHHNGGGQSAIEEKGGYYVYSFAIKPEDHQPSGTCNFSRIDNAVLNLDLSESGTLRIYAVNYNVLRIMSGMGGLAYSN